MNDLWTSEGSDPIKDIEAARDAIKNGPSYMDIYDAEQSLYKVYCKVTIQSLINKDYQDQVKTMLDTFSLDWKNRTFQLREILLLHPEFRKK